MLDLIVRNARIAGQPAPVDIGVRAGRIATVANRLDADAEHVEVHDAGGGFACGGLIETHIHLDKSRITERCAPESGRLANAMRRVSDVKHTFSVEDVYRRARTTLEQAIVHGVTRMRTHVEVDPLVGLRGFEALTQLQRDFAWALDLELCVFPQEGMLSNPGTEALMLTALRQGATVVGAAPSFDADPAGQIRRVFAMAREFDVDVDMHLDFGNDAEQLDVDLVLELTERYGWGGRVTIGHVTKLSTLPIEDQDAYARRLADAGIALTVLPATDLFLMGRNRSVNVHRGVVDAHRYAAYGCLCSLSTNNVLNPFTPFGDNNLVRIANLHANVLQTGSEAELAQCFAMVTDAPARLMNLGDYGIEPGNPADIVVFDADSPARIVAEIAAPLAVFRAGRRTVTRERPTIHHPAASGATARG
jgi:cytosine/creatinine deaminase